MQRLLFWLCGFLPLEIISDKDRPYLERYYLFTLLGVRFYIHRFVGSDPARGLHDHPWLWAGSIILSGWYYEERRGFESNDTALALASVLGTTGLVRNKVRWFNALSGDSFHRVVLPRVFVGRWIDGRYVRMATQHCWTLFFHRAHKTKPWGFLRRLEDHDCMLYAPHKSPPGKPADWWTYAVHGRDNTRRVPCQK